MDPIPLIAVSITVSLLALLLILKKKKKVSSKKTKADLLVKPKSGFISPLKRLLSKSIDMNQMLPDLEETLLSADLGVDVTTELLEELQEKNFRSSEDVLISLKNKMKSILSQSQNFQIQDKIPHVISFVGLNGTGKTTSLGKLAYKYRQAGKKVFIIAADTFRAAAVEQLQVWAERSGSDFHRGAEGADPSSVIFEALSAAQTKNYDLILIDTAGRLHNKEGLMEQLKKMQRVSQKALGRELDDYFLTLDATTGQNGLIQAQVFQETLPLTGLILTKYDGTAKGGIVFSIVKKTGLPIRFLGLGESAEDLKDFEADAFVEALFE